MTQSASLPRLGSEFDAFLFASIGDDKNGMLLSVLSALARLDIDPWQEAASLAGLPGGRAIERLSSLIAALPGRAATYPDSGTTAARLIALLPAGTNSVARPAVGISAKSAPSGPKAVIGMLAINVFFFLMVMGAQWMATSHRPPPQIAEGPAAISRPVGPQPSGTQSKATQPAPTPGD